MGIAIPDYAVTDRLSGERFRAFQARRPDHERWELIAGIPMMMPPPTIIHNLIASNLQRVLNDALARHDPSRIAVQRTGIELGSGDYRPEPDVAVIDADYGEEQSFVSRCYLLAEIVSSSDYAQFPETRRPWIEVKRDLYLHHPPCQAVVIVAQSRIELRVDVRAEGTWRSETLVGPDAELKLAGFGLHCPLGALYRGTPLLPRVV